VYALPDALIGRGAHAVAASSQRASAHQAGGDRVSLASGGVRRLRRGVASAVARGGAQRDLGSSGPGHGGAVYGGLSLVQAHDAPEDG
jgi:hypothetical protein